MDGSRERLIDPALRRVPHPRRSSSEARIPVHLDELRGAWPLILGAGWPLAFMIAMAVEPAPADPEATGPLVVELAGLAFLALLGTTVATAFARRRLAAVAGVGAGVLGTMFSVMCPVSGHHALGLWWFAQMGVILTMLVASVVALASPGTGSPVRDG